MKRVISCVLLMLVLTSNAFALEVPTGTVVQNLNGSQQAIKTFTVSPEQDPAALIEEPFELEGYLYTFADIVKSENPVEEKRIHTEVITVETTKDDLALILEQLKPTIEYDDGRFQGIRVTSPAACLWQHRPMCGITRPLRVRAMEILTVAVTPTRIPMKPISAILTGC